MRTTIGIIGNGGIASALVEGWLRPSASETDLLVSTVAVSGDDKWTGVDGVTVATSLEDLARRADVIIVVAEPEDSVDVLGALGLSVGEGTPIVSAGTGVTLQSMRAAAGVAPALFRAVFNPGIALGEGVVALFQEIGAAPDVTDSVAGLFAHLGAVHVLPEDTLDAVTAVTGSSVGFLALALQGLEDGAVSAGLPRATARPFVRQTALGTARLLLGHPGSPADLKDQVASPGGTTIAGLAVLEQAGVRGAFIKAIEEAVVRHGRSEDAGRAPVIE